ncbi:MAG: metalloregulator ArsR/SmtB family transcription factor [Planctomycetes bacterium]|nr:metalloregulator ArsR/SmtB family transcription factor [Planctomycetota bacterium]
MPDSAAETLSCAGLLKVLADETRLAVVQQLLDGPKHVGEMNASLGVEQSLLSHHLKVLREAGLVTSRRDGKAVLYSLVPEFEAARRGKAINLGCCLIAFE